MGVDDTRSFDIEVNRSTKIVISSRCFIRANSIRQQVRRNGENRIANLSFCLNNSFLRLIVY